MFILKKAQQAIEFMLILVFVMALIAGAMYVSGKFLNDFKQQENVELVNNFVDNVNKEIEIMGKVEGGYYRELEIYSSRYDVNLTANGSLLIIKDKNTDNTTYYFDLLENPDFIVKLDTIVRDGVDMYILIFEKLSNKDYDGLALDENSTIITAPLGWPEFNATFEMTACDDLEIYRINGISGAHGGVGVLSTYIYRLCAEHNNYNLGNSCSGNYETLFYLGNVTNSHMWLDNSTATTAPEPYPGYYNWQEICISSDAGIITRTDSTSDLSLDYECFGSYYSDSPLNGYSLGDCGNYPGYTKIWVNIE